MSSSEGRSVVLSSCKTIALDLVKSGGGVDGGGDGGGGLHLIEGGGVVGSALPELLRSLFSGATGHLAVDVLVGGVVEERLFLEEVK